MGEWMGGWDGAIWDDFSSWICPFPVGDMDRPLSGWGYGPAPFPHLLSPSPPSLMRLPVVCSGVQKTFHASSHASQSLRCTMADLPTYLPTYPPTCAPVESVTAEPFAEAAVVAETADVVAQDMMEHAAGSAEDATEGDEKAAAADGATQQAPPQVDQRALNEALLRAVDDLQPSEVARLLERRADAAYEKRDEGGWGAYDARSPIHKALRENCLPIITLLLEAGAKVCREGRGSLAAGVVLNLFR